MYICRTKANCTFFPVAKILKKTLQKFLHDFPKKFESKFAKTAPNYVYWIPVTTLIHRLPYTILSQVKCDVIEKKLKVLATGDSKQFSF